MVSISEMIDNAYEKKVLEQFTNISSFEFPARSFIISGFVNNNVRSRLRLAVEEDEDDDVMIALLYELWNSEDGEWDAENILFQFPNKKYSDEKFIKELCRYVRYFLKNLNNLCYCCSKPFDFESDLIELKSKSHNLISNLCIDCGNCKLSSIHTVKYILEVDIEEICCDICNEIMIEKDTEDKIKVNKMNKLNCCKCKFLCKNCCLKQTDKCFFCRQIPDWECLI